MVANTKAKGTGLELEYQDYFQKWGYYCIRAAGSFGIDLVAVKKGYKTLMINVKWLRKYCGPDERKELIKIADMADGLPILAYKVIPKGKKNGVRTIEILFNEKQRGGTLTLGPLKESSGTEWWKFLLATRTLSELNSKRRSVDLSETALISGLHPYNPSNRQYSLPQTNQ